MAVKGTPLGGLSEIAKRVYIDGADVTLVAYTNTRNTLSSASVAADLTQPTSTNGYAPILLDGTWSELDGVATYQHPLGPSTDPTGNPQWHCTGTWSANVTGVALIFGTRLLHFKDSTDNVGVPQDFVAAAGKNYAVAISNLVSP